MTLVARTERDKPYARDHERSIERGMERGKMPQSLEGLMRWFLGCVTAELPDKLHRQELWRDQVSAHERDEGIRPVGGSLIGSLAWSGPTRVYLEREPSATDDDGYYLFPARLAVDTLARRYPFMARALRGCAMNGGDWHALANAWDMPAEVMETFVAEALRRLWLGWHDRTTRGMT